MRLLERTLKMIYVAPRMCIADGIGGVTEEFEPDGKFVRGSVIPSTGKLASRPMGVRQVQSMCLLLPADAAIRAGDGVGLDSKEIEWRCTDVQRWSAHVAVQVERI